MKTNDIKKGMRVQMRNGWFGTMADNARGNTRMVTVEGLYTETGSVYAHDIAGVLDPVRGWVDVEYTDAQNKLRNTVTMLMGD